MRTKTLLPLILAAACGSSNKPTEPIPTPHPPDVVKPDRVETAQDEADAALVAEAKGFTADVDKELRRVLVAASETEWANETDITDEHEAAAAKAAGIQNDTIAKLIKQARKYERVMAKLDPETRRQLQVLINITTVATPVAPSPDNAEHAAELAKLAAEMSSTYGKGKVCTGTGKQQKCQDLDALSKVLQTTKRSEEGCSPRGRAGTTPSATPSATCS